MPRVFEKIYNSAEQKATAEGRGRIFARGRQHRHRLQPRLGRRGGPGPLLRLKHGLFDRLVYAKLRAAMGGKVQYAVSGGAPARGPARPLLPRHRRSPSSRATA